MGKNLGTDRGQFRKNLRIVAILVNSLLRVPRGIHLK